MPMLEPPLCQKRPTWQSWFPSTLTASRQNLPECTFKQTLWRVEIFSGRCFSDIKNLFEASGIQTYASKFTTIWTEPLNCGPSLASKKNKLRVNIEQHGGHNNARATLPSYLPKGGHDYIPIFFLLSDKWRVIQWCRPILKWAHALLLAQPKMV